MTGRPTVERDGARVVVRVPMELKRRGGRKEVVVPAGLPGSPSPEAPAQAPLVAALARAFRWQGLLDEGRCASLGALAAALGLDRSYVGKTLRLALLAPDVVEAILAGREPSGLSLDRLMRGVPLLWGEQRRRFGFGATTTPLPRPQRQS